MKTMPKTSSSADNQTQADDWRRHGPSIVRRDGEKAMNKERVTSLMYSILMTLMVMAAPAIVPDHAVAQAFCSEPGSGDFDQDGFSDSDECSATGITTPGSGLNPVPLTFPACVAGAARETCVDANSRDLFVIFKPATTGPAPTGSLLGNNGISLTSSPFRNVTVTGTNIAATFTGLSALGITAHLIAENNAGANREIWGSQKAIKITESLDPNGTILGNCQWGTPQDLDGCVVFTQRILNFINSTCDSAGDRTTDRLAVFRAYATFIILHEAGHSLGGLKAVYNSRFGGYHEKSGAGVIMEQSAAYAAKGGKCTFYISSGWNTSEDPSTVDLNH
jgi:hypothetical protein